MLTLRERLCLLALVLVAFVAVAMQNKLEGGRVLDSKLHHLGDDNITYWPEVSPEPEGTRLDVRFDATKNEKDFTLSLTCWDVNDPSFIEVNGKRVAEIKPTQNRREDFVRIPAGTLKNGQNVISFVPGRETDDLVVGQLVLYPKPYRELMRLNPVTVSVTDARTGKPIPSRLAITNPKGELVEIFNAPTNRTALRKGVLYTAGTETTIQLPEGEYLIHATRGMEWSRDSRAISVGHGKSPHVKLKLRHEVDTRGFVAADTHIHTLTFSGHGDASVEERMITLAGEGVELAVATDHNHHTDYRPYQEKLRLNDYFTPVTGNEVSTPAGHFNAFPMDPKGEVPPFRGLTEWVAVVDGIRAKGGKVIILNHPRWPNRETNTFLRNELNRLTGERGSGMAVTFDAMELVNSCVSETNSTYLLTDWFALLNHGETIKAVGTSDSHSVNDPVGGGRTYVRSSTDNPAKINVDEMCKNILAGDCSVSEGIFLDVSVNGRFTMGQVAPVKGRSVKIKARVAAPSWVTPRRVVVYLNGREMSSQSLNPRKGKSFDQTLTFNLPAPSHDAHLVCAVFGDDPAVPGWRTSNPFSLAVNNPVFLDANGDGVYSSPRETAARLLATIPNPDEQWQLLGRVDDAIAAQMLAQLQKTLNGAARLRLEQRLEKEAQTRGLFREYLNALQIKASATGG